MVRICVARELLVNVTAVIYSLEISGKSFSLGVYAAMVWFEFCLFSVSEFPCGNWSSFCLVNYFGNMRILSMRCHLGLNDAAPFLTLYIEIHAFSL